MHVKKISRLILAASLATPAMAFMPMSAQAGGSANIGIANMYLWRGLDVSSSTAQVSGTLQYNHDSGFYAGTWASSLGGSIGGGVDTSDDSYTFPGNYELDLYAGYSGSAGDFKYDISYWEYLYPEAGDVDAGLGDTDASDLVLSVSYDMFSAAAYIGMDSDLPDAVYYTLGVSSGKFGAVYGFWTGDDDALDYSHITLSYNPIESLTFKLSMASSGDTEVEEDPLVQVSYTWGFDL
ncbi:MAG: hypothetical protein IT489_02600 [Gammaproteobacteria bacterium]|nr:hypothetical protein [Gammaproteobacteria bacterium]